MAASAFGTFIRDTRESQLTQTELGDKLDVTQQTVCRWESGHIAPPVRHLPKLAKALQVDEADLYRALVSDAIAEPRPRRESLGERVARLEALLQP